MRIGILTFHRSINYGSVLQAWALQQVLLENGYMSEVIDYEPKEYKHIYPDSVEDALGIKSKIKRILTLQRCDERMKSKFKKFRDKNLIMGSNTFYGEISFDELQQKYDIIITGSDQIWNTSLMDCDEIYFLPFKFSGKKIAYACSFNCGTINSRFCKEWLAKWINDYDFVSIREKSGAKKISNIIDYQKKVYKTIDPTMFHNKQFYTSIIGNRIQSDDYIFLYNMWSRQDGIDAAKIIAQKENIPVYTITNQMDLIKIFKNTRHGIKVDLIHTGPEEFLNYLFYSKYVVTDSFHGTAFSIIFNKQFITVNSQISCNKYKNDERLVNLLQQFGLQRRLLNLSEIKEMNINEPIDYEHVNELRMKTAQMSLELLLNSIRN